MPLSTENSSWHISQGISFTLFIATLLFLAVAGPKAPSMAAESAQVIAPPAIDEKGGQATSEIAVLAGGCFWGVQGVFQHVEGVTNAVSGYAGGAKETARYETIGTGTTG